MEECRNGVTMTMIDKAYDEYLEAQNKYSEALNNGWTTILGKLKYEKELCYAKYEELETIYYL